MIFEIFVVGLLIINMTLTLITIALSKQDKCNYPNCALVDFYKNRKSIDDLPSLTKDDTNAKL